ncbi:MAG: DUF2255 family protein [Candidatus Limnocylindria bacterium]
MSARFEAADLALLRDEEEVEIETSASGAGPIHRTIIWVVVDDRDRVLIRSYLGAAARWYREVTARTECRVLVREGVIEAVALPAGDEERVTACTEGFRRKYAGQTSTRSMMQKHLETTLELAPR